MTIGEHAFRAPGPDPPLRGRELNLHIRLNQRFRAALGRRALRHAHAGLERAGVERILGIIDRGEIGQIQRVIGATKQVAARSA